MTIITDPDQVIPTSVNPLDGDKMTIDAPAVSVGGPFAYDDSGRITFRGEPYLYSSCGTTTEGMGRFTQYPDWLNKCFSMDAAREVVGTP